jgi:Na+/proline symporter
MQPVLGDIALYVAVAMAVFAMLFGTRHIDATEHQDGLMLAIATESIVKLVAFVAVGVFVTFWMFDGPVSLFARALERPDTAAVLTREPALGTLGAMTLLSLFAIVLLPRQFHVTVVENNSEDEIKRASWLFPLYLVLINLFVVPIALAGLLTFAPGQVDSDMFVLALPLAGHSDLLTIAAFVGGLSAATAMVIVESVALAIMVSNDILMPLALQRREALVTGSGNLGGLLLGVRRMAIFVILALAYVYYRLAGEAQLASIGLLSFAAIAQLAPAFFGGLIWRRATARGALAGMTIGILIWAYTLLLPSFADAGIVGQSLLSQGPWGISALRPQALIGLDLPPLAHGVIWSLTLNVLAYIVFSVGRAPAAIERLQADLFVPSDLTPIPPSFRLWRSSVTVEELTTTVARYLGEERTRSSFDSYALTRGISIDAKAEADFQLLRYAEHLLASAIGAASSRLVLSLLLRKRTVSTKAALKLLDDANAAIHYNREILQTALDHVRQGHRGVRQGPAPGVLEPAIRRDSRPAASAHPRRDGARADPALQRRAQHRRAKQRRRARARAARTIRRERRAVSRALRRARPGDGGACQSDAGRRHRHHLHRHYADSESGRGARARQRVTRAAGGGAHRAAHQAEHGARPRQGGGRASQHFQDPVPGGGKPRHSATTQRCASLRHQPGRAPDCRQRYPAHRQYRRFARCGRRNLQCIAGHLPARHRRAEARDRQLPYRRAVPPARGRIRAACPGEGAQAQVRRLRIRSAIRPPTAAAAAAEPGVERDQVYDQRPRAGRLPAAARTPAHRRL